MTLKSRDAKPDGSIVQILDQFREYDAAHPEAEIEAYRRNPGSVRLRVIDPAFAGLDRVEREEVIWKVLERLPEEVQQELSLVVLVTPAERSSSFASIEFEDPIPSRL